MVSPRAAEAGQDQRGAGADVGGVNFGAGQFGFAKDQGAVGIGDLDVGAHFAQFVQVLEAIFIKRFVTPGFSLAPA